MKSTGAFIAVSRYASATPSPPSILSRGVGWQGIGILLSGLFGTVNGSSVSVENAGLLALTRVGSRRVVQIAAGFMIFFSILVPTEKMQALILADSMLTIIGEMWLITKTKLSDIVEQQPIPPERCLLLVVEISRVEVAVLLNDLSYLKYGAPKIPSNAESLALNQRNLAIAFSLIKNSFECF